MSLPFLFLTCQVGAEAAAKREIARQWPDFRFAFSRPGLLTFKLAAQHDLPLDFDLASVFARCRGFTLGTVRGAKDERARRTWELARPYSIRRVHVWQRDRAPAGEHGYEPGPTAAADAAELALWRERPPERAEVTGPGEHADRPLSRRGELVLDCVLVDDDHWLVGLHQVRDVLSRWPGGILPLTLPEGAVSRAWLKMEEALRWSRLPVRRGDRWAELGCAPGGACQNLLARGCQVIGVDPALVHPEVQGHERFRQIRKRAGEVRHKELKGVEWLAADMNVAPRFTLDAAEAVCTRPDAKLKGMLLTIKLPDWKLADELPEWLARVRSWGFPRVAARQLVHNRQEVCVAARR